MYLGILDSAVQGGLIHYKLAFLSAAYEARRPEHAPLIQRLRDLIADQVPLLKYGKEFALLIFDSFLTLVSNC